MDDKPRFARDLFQGTAEYYDRYRLSYPDEMIRDLVQRAAGLEDGRLLDLACGTGQLAFALRRWVRLREIWAVDREPDMVAMVRAKAVAGGAGEIRAMVSDAESLEAEPGSFELVVVGSAFHRLDRELVAGRVLEWLKPGGHLAVCWSSQPWDDRAESGWQLALAETLEKWRTALGVRHRVPDNWEEPQRLRPDVQVMGSAGFEVAGHHEFAVEHRWTLAELGGLVRSTSFLSAPVLGDQGEAFDADLAASLRQYSQDGGFTEVMNYAYDLARKPA